MYPFLFHMPSNYILQARQDGVSSCMMGSEGFSWCSTEHMWYRDDHWYDWDTCSLCLEGKTDQREQLHNV